MDSMRTRIPWIAMVVLLCCNLSHSLSAQVPASLSDTVLSMQVYEPMGAHTTIKSADWLKADGTFVVLWAEYAPNPGQLVFSPLPGAATSGTWSYSATGLSTGTLIMTTPGQQSTVFALTFTSFSSGTSTSGTFSLNTGTFALRASGYGTGPSNLSVLTSIRHAGASDPESGGPATIGFVLSGSAARYVLVRALGPSLNAFGVPATASGLGLTVTDSAGNSVGTGVDWSVAANGTTLFQNLFTTFGAFPLTPSSGESCAVIALNPGAYAAQATASGPGSAMIEVYFLP